MARKALRHRDEIAASITAADDTDIAGRDQRAAAARDTEEASRQTIEELQTIGVDIRRLPMALNERSLAWSLAVAGAINRRIPEDRRCPHATPGARRPLTALLTSRLLYCETCKASFARRYASRFRQDDGLCDVCDRPSDEFSEFTMAAGGVRYIGNICPICSLWAQRAQDS
jgi:hypothetical protein